jgi:hypothetical protein
MDQASGLVFDRRKERRMYETCEWLPAERGYYINETAATVQEPCREMQHANCTLEGQDKKRQVVHRGHSALIVRRATPAAPAWKRLLNTVLGQDTETMTIPGAR